MICKDKTILNTYAGIINKDPTTSDNVVPSERAIIANITEKYDINPDTR